MSQANAPAASVILRVVNWTSVIRWPDIKPMIGLQTQ